MNVTNIHLLFIHVRNFRKLRLNKKDIIMICYLFFPTFYQLLYLLTFIGDANPLFLSSQYNISVDLELYSYALFVHESYDSITRSSMKRYPILPVVLQPYSCRNIGKERNNNCKFQIIERYINSTIKNTFNNSE